MKNLYSNIILAFVALLVFTISISGQKPENNKYQPTKEQIMDMSYDDLLNLPFEDLINLANIVGVSAEDLLQMILNKEVSSASKSNETVFQSPLSTTVITKEEIYNSGITSIPEVLRMVPGIIVRQKTPGNYDVHIRGNDNVPPKNLPVYSENSLSLVMIDGRPVYNSAFGGTFWETLPIGLNDIERIEVIRGPSSALYGPNAVSGVINIITVNPEEKKLKVIADAQVGGLDTYIANGSTSFGLGKFRTRISGNFTQMGRFDNKLYHFRDSTYLTVDEMSTRYYNNPLTDMPYLALGINEPEEENIINKIPNPDRATYQYGVNIFINYDANEKVGFNVSAGLQSSDNITNVFGNHEVPMSTRTSNTNYFDFRAKVYGFQAQVNFLTGDQDYERLNNGFHVDLDVLNSSLEYEYKFKTLTLRPGISYQQSIYGDSEYLVPNTEGYLNGFKNLNSFAYYLRADYRMFEKLRLIAAIRGDKYNKPNKNYFTYQFIASYELNDKNIIRALYSRANRGPFMTDTYSDFTWKVISNETTGVDFYTLKYLGNEDLKLPQMDMFEIGYRTSITKNIQIDIEAFRTKTTNYSYFMADSMYAFPDASAVNPLGVKYSGTIVYQNFDLEATQTGATATINVGITKNLYFNIFATFQQTKLKNFYPLTISNVLGGIMNEATYKLQTGTGNTAKASTDSVVDMDHKNTPSYFGGAEVVYKPISKLTINSTVYFYGEQTYLMKDVETTVDPKVLINLKVSYNFWKQNNVYVNVRNLLNDDAPEFGFLDKIGCMYLIGVSLSF